MSGTMDREGTGRPGLLAIADDCLAALTAALTSKLDGRLAELAAQQAGTSPASEAEAAELWESLGFDPASVPPAAAKPEQWSQNVSLIADLPPESAPEWRIYHRPRRSLGQPAQPFEFGQKIVMQAPIADFLHAAYRGLLRREPDLDGLAHYRARIAEGHIARHEVLRAMATSDEARRLDLELLIVTTDAPAPASA
ncbi:MAG: DUF4214 domain-containing protein [Acetobacteraceae bacterium]|nr:DUF4214 domain-containing protein [Acetobacteraceae bacterium]